MIWDGFLKAAAEDVPEPKKLRKKLRQGAPTEPGDTSGASPLLCHAGDGWPTS